MFISARNGSLTSAKLQQPQRGAVLIVGLLILLVMTLIGVTAMQTTTLEERMAGNLRDMSLAFQASEAALHQGETDLATDATYQAMKFDGTDGTYPGGIDPFDKTKYAKTFAGTNFSLQGLAEQPAYYIEELPAVKLPRSSVVSGFEPPPTITYYRVTGRGVGATNTAVATVQSTYLR